MIGEPLLDTNVVIDLFAGQLKVVEQLQVASKVFVPVIVIGELYFGAEKSMRVEENIARVTALIPLVRVLTVDADTARLYSIVRQRLKQAGKPIPENDVWIAATALQHQLTLISRDQHFNLVEGLNVATW